MDLFREYGSDEAKVTTYAHRLAQAEERQRRWAPVADRWIARYENVPNSRQFSANGHNVSVPTGTSIIDSLFSSLTAADVNVMVHALGKGTRDQEELASAALSKEWTVTKAPQRTGKAIKDSLLVGIGWVKVGYEYYSQEEEVPRAVDDIAEDIDKLIKEAEEAGHDIDAQTIANYVPLVETKENTLSERVVVDYVPWNRVLWDPTAKQVEDIRWVAQLSFMPAEEVKAHPIFREYCARNKTTRQLEDLAADSTLDLGAMETTLTDAEQDGRVTVVEMWDFETGTTCTFAKGADFLLNEAPNPFAMNDDLEDKSPFVPLTLRQSPGRVRGISEMEVMMPTLEELDLYHSKLATYIERMAPKVMGPKGIMTDTGRDALRSQEYGAFVELEQGTSANDIKDFQPPQLPSEVFGVPMRLEQALREATGVNELMRGLFPDRKRTATETAEVVTASAARQAEKRVQLERFYEAVGRRVLQLMQMFYTAERMVRYVDWEGPTEWEWTADDIVMESRLEIVLTPKEVRNWQSRRDDALAVLNVLGPLAQPGNTGASPVDMNELLRYVLTELGLPRATILMLLNLPEEQQAQMLAAQQQAAGMQAASQLGVPRPDMVPGPMDAEMLAAATNQGTIPPEVLAAAQGTTPVSPQAAEQVSEDIGIAGL